LAQNSTKNKKLDIFLKVYLIWLVGVVIWNFGFPNAKPIYDVLAAVLLSILSLQLNRIIK
jgi:predicted membrane protein|tara:strand:- start:6983 stop:7162 length:180 start_codon:yes stop_codon:yes gene_type:complete